MLNTMMVKPAFSPIKYLIMRPIPIIPPSRSPKGTRKKLMPMDKIKLPTIKARALCTNGIGSVISRLDLDMLMYMPFYSCEYSQLFVNTYKPVIMTNNLSHPLRCIRPFLQIKSKSRHLPQFNLCLNT